jgi:glutamyl-tRNA(Gln) amidotransferase subunit E
VPPVQISPDRVQHVRDSLPKMPDQVAKEIESKYHLSPKLAVQLVNSEYFDTFGEIAATAKGVAPSVIATVLTESLRSLSREKVPIENLTETHLKLVFRLVNEGKTAKESALEIIKWLAVHPTANAEAAIVELNLGMMPKAELTAIISKVLDSNKSFVKENGSKAIGKMMNLIMAEVRGRADPKTVTELLQSQLEQIKG